MIKDYFRFALSTISHRKLRSWLTMIGIFIGISAVVALISLGQGFSQAVKKEFEKIGTDKLFIMAKSGFGPPGQNAVVQLTKDDMDVAKRITGVENVAGFVMANTKIEFEDNVDFFAVYSFPEGQERKLMAETLNLKIKDGRELRDSDRFSALIGINIAEKKKLGENVKLRDKLKVNGVEFTVVGILEKTGDPETDGNMYIPESALRDIFNQPEKIDMLIVQVADVENINAIAEKIENNLRRLRNVKKGEEDFDIQTPEQLFASFQDVLNIITSVLVGLAVISLVVGGVGIANTMYTAVLERKKEIGIMKSVGAQKKDILLLFLIESGILGGTGGLIGILLGFGLSKGVEIIAKTFLGTNLIEAYFSVQLFLIAFFFSFFLGVIFGVLPAMQAASLKPVDALRSK